MKKHAESLENERKLLKSDSMFSKNAVKFFIKMRKVAITCVSNGIIELNIQSFGTINQEAIFTAVKFGLGQFYQKSSYRNSI